MSSLKEEGSGSLGQYDAIIMASGAGIRRFPELEKLEVEFVKGRTLVMEDAQNDEAALESVRVLSMYTS